MSKPSSDWRGTPFPRQVPKTSTPFHTPAIEEIGNPDNVIPGCECEDLSALCRDAYVGPCAQGPDDECACHGIEARQPGVEPYRAPSSLRRWIAFKLLDLGCRVLGNEMKLVVDIALAMVAWRQRHEA